MFTPVPSSTPATSGPDERHRWFWQVPDLPDDDRLVGGVASGLAREVGIDPLWVRLCFVGLFALGGWGGLLYLVLWGVISTVAYRGHVPEHDPTPKARSLRLRFLGVGLIVTGFAALFGQLGGLPASVLWPVGVVAAGVLVALQKISPTRDGFLPSWFPSAQVLGGSVAALGVFAGARAFDLGGDQNPVLVVGAVLVGLVVVSAPWWWQLVSELDAERQARTRADERAEVAAHIHDSVLQTLALIQKGDDPRVIAQLARRQERELRNWLDPDRASRSGESIRGQLDELASDVENLHGVPVEVVCVGDAIVVPPIDGLLAATREAVVNAAKHSGAPRIDVYAEVGDRQIELFVRDTGRGFDMDAVRGDRRGLRESITGRMERIGGSAVVFSELGEGTEVELRVRRPESISQKDPS